MNILVPLLSYYVFLLWIFDRAILLKKKYLIPLVTFNALLAILGLYAFIGEFPKGMRYLIVPLFHHVLFLVLNKYFNMVYSRDIQETRNTYNTKQSDDAVFNMIYFFISFIVIIFI